MASNVALFFSVIVLLTINIKIEGKKNRNEKLSYFLTRYEITQIVELNRRSPFQNTLTIGKERSFVITAFGITFMVDLSVFYPRQDPEISYISKLTNNSITFENDDFPLFQGYVRNFNTSFVLGYFSERRTFRGYIVTDEVFCIEPYDFDEVIIYRFKDVISPGCVKISEDEDLDCSEARYFVPWHANKAPPVRPLRSEYSLFYDKYFQIHRRHEATRTPVKKNSSIGKHHDSIKEQDHKSNKKVKSKTDTKNESEINMSHSKEIKDEGSHFESKSGRRNLIQTKNSSTEKSKPNEKKKKDDKSDKDYDDYDDYDEKSNIKILNDEDRFPVTHNNVLHQNYLNDSSRNMNEFFLNIDFLDSWKSEFTENSEKQAIKRKLKSTYIEPIVETLESDVSESFQCDVKLVVAPSLINRFDDDLKGIIKDIIIQFTLLNKIFFKLPLQRGKQKTHFFLNAAKIDFFGDDVYSPLMGRASLEHFTKSIRDPTTYCLIIGLVSQSLLSGDFFDGYAPEGNGGVCSDDGNTMIASHGKENTPAPMALYFSALVRGITRAMGATDKDPECAEGTYPNPLKVLKDYLLTDEILSVSEYSIFTSCNVKEIEDVFIERNCFQRVSQPLCGNAILDPGEQCDCGPSTLCRRVDPCCNIPGLFVEESNEVKKSCTLIEGANCSSLEECCEECSILKTKRLCVSGAFPCDISLCNGASSSCPTGVEASNGMICYENKTLMEPMVCKDNMCNQPLCSSSELQPCSCALGTKKECLYCCMKDGKCQSVRELELFPDKNFFLPDGVQCMEGLCQQGVCITLSGEEQIYNDTDTTPGFPVSSDARDVFLTMHITVGSVLSLLLLFLLQL